MLNITASKFKRFQRELLLSFPRYSSPKEYHEKSFRKLRWSVAIPYSYGINREAKNVTPVKEGSFLCEPSMANGMEGCPVRCCPAQCSSCQMASVEKIFGNPLSGSSLAIKTFLIFTSLLVWIPEKDWKPQRGFINVLLIKYYEKQKRKHVDVENRPPCFADSDVSWLNISKTKLKYKLTLYPV